LHGVALHILAQVYVERGRLAEARRALDEAWTLVGFTVMPRPANESTAQWVYETTAARVRMADAPAEAAAILRVVADAAAKSGYLNTAYEARLYLAEAERRLNRPAAARAGLDRLQRDAAAKGLVLIARKAAAAAEGRQAARR
jgi:hypothetical protein